jgi:hypothetical protein
MKLAFDFRVAYEVGGRYDRALSSALTRRLLTESDGKSVLRAFKYFVLTLSKSIPIRLLQPIKDE